MAKHLIFPVLTGIPKSEQVTKEKYVPISEENDTLSSIFVKLSPIECIILFPPKRAPSPSTKDTLKGMKNGIFSLCADMPNRNKIMPINLSPLWYPCIYDVREQDKICSPLYGKFHLKIRLII